MKIFQKFKIYTQEDLVKPNEGLKDRLQFRINNYSNELVKQTDHQDFINQSKELGRLQSDLRKVKFIIAFNNLIFGVNKLIYHRESLKKAKDTLTDINSRYKIKSKLPKELKSIDNLISTLDKDIEIIDSKLKRRNKNIRCILRLTENYK